MSSEVNINMDDFVRLLRMLQGMERRKSQQCCGKFPPIDKQVVGTGVKVSVSIKANVVDGGGVGESGDGVGVSINSPNCLSFLSSATEATPSSVTASTESKTDIPPFIWSSSLSSSTKSTNLRTPSSYSSSTTNDTTTTTTTTTTATYDYDTITASTLPPPFTGLCEGGEEEDPSDRGGTEYNSDESSSSRDNDGYLQQPQDRVLKMEMATFPRLTATLPPPLIPPPSPLVPPLSTILQPPPNPNRISLIVADISNIYAGAKETATTTKKKTFLKKDSRVRVDVDKLMQTVEAGRQVTRRVASGSEKIVIKDGQLHKCDNPAKFYFQDAGFQVHIISRMEGESESGVDEYLVSEIEQSIPVNDAWPRGRIVVLSGDGNSNAGRPSIGKAIHRALKRNMHIEIWAWRSSINPMYDRLVQKYPKSMRIEYLDTYRDQITFKAKK